MAKIMFRFLKNWKMQVNFLCLTSATTGGSKIISNSSDLGEENVAVRQPGF